MNQVLLKIEFNNHVNQVSDEAESLSGSFEKIKINSDVLLIKLNQILVKTLDLVDKDTHFEVEPDYFSLACQQDDTFQGNRDKCIRG